MQSYIMQTAAHFNRRLFTLETLNVLLKEFKADT
jgi:hypothetical protein